MSSIQSGKFVNVIASLDLETGDGKILYVNPSSIAVAHDDALANAGPAAGHAEYELSIQDETGVELRRYPAPVRVSSCESGGPPKTGLISEDISYVPGMRRIVLLHDGSEISRFEAGTPGTAIVEGLAAAPDTAAESIGIASSVRSLQLKAPEHTGVHKRRLSTTEATVAQKGVSYTVQLQPLGSTVWQTIAVGRATPDVQIDENQFPGIDKARIRVLRSTGIEDELFAESVVDLGG